MHLAQSRSINTNWLLVRKADAQVPVRPPEPDVECLQEPQDMSMLIKVWEALLENSGFLTGGLSLPRNMLGMQTFGFHPRRTEPEILGVGRLYIVTSCCPLKLEPYHSGTWNTTPFCPSIGEIIKTCILLQKSSWSHPQAPTQMTISKARYLFIIQGLGKVMRSDREWQKKTKKGTWTS